MPWLDHGTQRIISLVPAVKPRDDNFINVEQNYDNYPIIVLSFN